MPQLIGSAPTQATTDGWRGLPRFLLTHADFLLLPAARFRGPRPAVLVPFYAPEVSVAYDGPRALTGQARRFFKDGPPVHRDFALQLARRGFVTLAIRAEDRGAGASVTRGQDRPDVLGRGVVGAVGVEGLGDRGEF